MGEDSHPELADFMVRSLHFPFKPFFEVIHVTLCFVVCLLEHIQVVSRLLQEFSLTCTLAGDIIYDRSCRTQKDLISKGGNTEAEVRPESNPG